MKIKFTEKIEREEEVKLPAFTKTSCHHFKVISETECLKICELGGHNEISHTFPELAFSGDYENCTEEEFNAAYERVLKLLKN